MAFHHLPRPHVHHPQVPPRDHSQEYAHQARRATATDGEENHDSNHDFYEKMETAKLLNYCKKQKLWSKVWSLLDIKSWTLVKIKPKIQLLPRLLQNNKTLRYSSVLSQHPQPLQASPHPATISNVGFFLVLIEQPFENVPKPLKEEKLRVDIICKRLTGKKKNVLRIAAQPMRKTDKSCT